MPINPFHPVTRLSQEDFRDLSYAVMAHIFEIHNEYGRFFHEWIYKQELARRFPGVELEFPIVVSHGKFSTTLFVDALIANGGIFEFKTVDTIGPHHRGQLFNYLLLLDLAHGKLLNMRGERVDHEFVNCTLRLEDRFRYQIDTTHWNRSVKGTQCVFEYMVELLADWGTSLSIDIYEAALTHGCGGESQVTREVAVCNGSAVLGYQPMRLAEDGSAFRVTAFEVENPDFRRHAERMLQHLDLRALLWINIGRRQVTFTTLEQADLPE
jgi:GxxExxY protein